ncbi:MAG TPA: hypothetical protein VJ964_05545 [Balneolaceae bacterium]|nr:hypothetical protein [Balneolaceae bacterium]
MNYSLFRIRLCLLIIISIVVGIGCQKKSTESKSQENRIEIAGFFIGQKMGTISECADITPDRIVDQWEYFCEVNNPSLTLNGIGFDDFTLEFNENKTLTGMAIGIYGNDDVLGALQKHFGTFKKIINSANEYYFTQDSIEITYRPGYINLKSRNKRVRYHTIRIRSDRL